MFILSTLSDGPYWTSALEPLLYPTGCSFYRPFSYRKEYVQAELLKVLENSSDRFVKNKNENFGFFGFRFKNPDHPDYQGRFIPLRRVEITSASVSDTVQVRIRLQEFSMSKAKERLGLIRLGKVVDYRDPQERILLTKIPRSDVPTLSFRDTPPDNLWDLLLNDENISPITRNQFSGTSFLRLERVCETGKIEPLFPEQLGTAGTYPTYGFRLRSKKTYDFALAYRRLLMRGASEDPIAYDFSFLGSQEHFLCDRSVLTTTGNYRSETTWIQPQIGLPACVLLAWIGVNKSDRSSPADPQRDKILPLHIPVKTFATNWPLARLICLGVFAAAFIGGAWSSYHAWLEAQSLSLAKPVQQGTQLSTALVSFYCATAAACWAIVASFLKDVIKGG